MRRGIPIPRRLWRWLIVGVAVLLAVTAGYVFVIAPALHQTTPVATAPERTAPLTPIAKPCDERTEKGVDRPPVGAIVISTTDDADRVVAAHPEPAVFWFSPGVHRLAEGKYAQIIPHDGDTFIGAPGAVLDGRRENQYAFGGHATDVTIQSLTVQNFGARVTNNNEGVVNHDSAERWKLIANVIQDNAGAGVMLGSGDVLTGNCLRRNGQYGFSAYHTDGVSDVVLRQNEVTQNNTDDWEKRQPGCGCTGGGKFWNTRGATVVDNYVHDNRGVGLWADTNNAGFLFEGNYISSNDGQGIIYEISYNAAILHNTFERNGIVDGPHNPTFPTAAIYVSESGSDSRVPGPYGQDFLISGNRFIDNWSGIVGWENADRFTGSPANTSTDSTTLVNPQASVKACSSALVATKPYIDDCRWKTQNLLVVGNDFESNPVNIPLCVRSTGCGFNGLFSNFGTYPAWSPFKGTVVEKNITFEQNNRFGDNTYRGSWSFMPEEAGKIIDWEAWRAAPYNQDADSTLNQTGESK